MEHGLLLLVCQSMRHIGLSTFGFRRPWDSSVYFLGTALVLRETVQDTTCPGSAALRICFANRLHLNKGPMGPSCGIYGVTVNHTVNMSVVLVPFRHLNLHNISATKVLFFYISKVTRFAGDLGWFLAISFIPYYWIQNIFHHSTCLPLLYKKGFPLGSMSLFSHHTSPKSVQPRNFWPPPCTFTVILSLLLVYCYPVCLETKSCLDTSLTVSHRIQKLSSYQTDMENYAPSNLQHPCLKQNWESFSSSDSLGVGIPGNIPITIQPRPQDSACHRGN